MAAIAVVNQAELRNAGWARRYPPLVAILVALAIALIIMPSSLNVPQSNPSTVLEYAPVPPSDDKPPPNANSGLGALGLGESSGVGGEGLGGNSLTSTTLPPVDDADNSKPNQRTSTTKRCVANKDGTARQTEDPLSPPCVASFDGDNFGATYQGVTRDEITILFYEDGSSGQLATSKGAQEVSPPPGTYKDLDDTPDDSKDFIHERTDRVWLKYFNDRFQTYGRRVHGWMFYGGNASSDAGAEQRRADASDNVSGHPMPKPFAVIDNAEFGGSNQAYQEAMAQRGVLVFEDLNGLANSFYKKWAPLVWGFWPDIERQADQYVSYVCSRVAGNPVSHSGNATDNGHDRVYGLISTSDTGYPGLQLLAHYVEEGVKPCGVTIKDHAEFPVAGYSVSAGQDPRYAATAMQKFQSEGITTILWAGGQETYFSKSAGSLNYFPEWVIAGDRVMDGFFNASQQDQNVWNHAWVVTNVACHGAFDSEPWVRAFREASGPDFPRRDISYAQPAYLDLFQLFRAIQVAGPRLGPTSVDKGFHAIPHSRSDDCAQPAGFYDAGDYSYVKDAQVMVYDAQADNPYSSQQPKGCYRMVENGKRYPAGGWTTGDEFTSKRYTGTEPCNSYDAGILIRTGPA